MSEGATELAEKVEKYVFESDPNFAIICSFVDTFRHHLGEDISSLTIEDLKEFFESTTGNV